MLDRPDFYVRKLRRAVDVDGVELVLVEDQDGDWHWLIEEDIDVPVAYTGKEDRPGFIYPGYVEHLKGGYDNDTAGEGDR